MEYARLARSAEFEKLESYHHELCAYTTSSILVTTYAGIIVSQEVGCLEPVAPSRILLPMIIS
jgi:hypothetical protein